MKVLVSVLLLLLSSLAAAEAVDWRAWSPDVFAEARREGRLVLLDLTADWCRFCKKMDAVTYRDARVVSAIGRDYVPVRADEKDHPDLAKRYADQGRPLTVIFDADGRELIARRGYLEPQWMLWLLQAVASDPDPTAHR